MPAIPGIPGNTDKTIYKQYTNTSNTSNMIYQLQYQVYHYTRQYSIPAIYQHQQYDIPAAILGIPAIYKYQPNRQYNVPIPTIPADMNPRQYLAIPIYVSRAILNCGKKPKKNLASRTKSAKS